jgi:nucleoside-diphosphate-sugar epimerase
MDWSRERILITGGASLIGSHLARALLKKGAKHILIVDDFSSGTQENLADIRDQVEVITGDLRDQKLTDQVVSKADYVFHLACWHGGRGTIATFHGATSTNFLLDALVFDACVKHSVKKVVFASSGCVYPIQFQNDTSQELYITEEMIGPPYYPDHQYGLAKLVGELTLKAYHNDFGLPSASLRFFTCYGAGVPLNHAVGAMIGRAMIKQDPFEVWGDGTQLRNWTYVEDIAEGTILAAEKISDATVINLGTMERTSVLEAAQYIMDLVGHKTEIKLRPEMPTGPKNRIADNSLAKRLLGWEPKTPFKQGAAKTVEWFLANRDPEKLKRNFEQALFERKV